MKQRAQSSALNRLPRLLLPLLFMLALFALTACGDAAEPILPTPNVDILVPTATALTARVEVLVVVVTPTAAPTATPTPGAEDSAENQDAAAAGGESEAGAQQSGSGAGADATPMSNQQLINMGEDIYAENCAECHQSDGQGLAEYPALNNSPVVTAGDVTQPIRFVLQGPGEMPAFEDDLSNRQIAAVLSYVRNSWDNDASVVHATQVRDARSGGAASAPEEQLAPEEQAAAEEQAATEEQAPAEGEAEPSPTPSPATAVLTATPDGDTEATPAPTATPTPAPGTAAAAEPASTATAQAPSPDAAAEANAATDTDAAPAGGAAAPPTWTPAPPQGGPPPTWTPDRAVTPLLPASANEDAAATSTPTPAPAAADEAEASPTPTPPKEDAGAADGEAAAQSLIDRGESIYNRECATCHQFDGAGTSEYPALSGSTLLTAQDPREAIEILLYGQGEMPAFDGTLSSEEIAAVLSYERNAWDNQAAAVTVEQVENARQ